MDQDITNTPRSNARRNERDGRTLDTPERRRIPQGPQLDLPPQPFPLAAAALPVGPIQSNDPFQNNYAPAPAPATAPAPAPVYHYLPAHLAQAAANLPPLQPVNRGRGRRGRLTPAPGPVFHHLPAHVAQAAAQLPPLQPVNRGRRGHHIQNDNWAPVQFQPAVPPVSLIVYISISSFYSYYI